MTCAQKQTLAKVFLFSGAGAGAVAMWGGFTYPALLGAFHRHYPLPIWAAVMTAIGSALIISGLLFGSRGLGKPLTAARMWSQILDYPCWIPFAIYMVGFLLFSAFGFRGPR